MKNSKTLLISSRPLEHSGMTKIELDVIEHNKGYIDFDVACGFRLEKEYEKILKEQDVKYIGLLPKKNIIAYMMSIFFTVRKGDYRNVYIHGNSSLMILEALPSKIAGATVITHCHNTRPARVAFYYSLLKPVFNAFVDYKIGCSEKASNWAYLGKHIVTIRNGVDINRFAYNPDVRCIMRKNLNLNGQFVVGHIGTFNEQKNHKKLVDIFCNIVSRIPEARLLMIGDGSLKQDTLAYIEKKGLLDHVIHVEHTEAPEDYLQAMDVVIMPSLFEGFCLVALEAQVSGLPVLVSEAIPEDAYATDRCIRIGLNESADYWAEIAMKTASLERRDMSDVIWGKGYSYEIMMNSIREVLEKTTKVS